MRILSALLIPLLALVACRSAPRPATGMPDTVTSPPVATASSSFSPKPALSCPKRLPRFEDYPADSVLHGNPVWPIVTLGPDSLQMQNRPNLEMAHASAGGPNFAGYLAIVQSGCGSPCQNQTLVDLRTGKVLGSLISSLSAAQRVNSRLLILNPMDTTQCYDTLCAYCRPIYYRW